MSKVTAIVAVIAALLGLVVGKFLWGASNPATPTAAQPTTLSSTDAVAPGQLDSYYAFLSGGQSGDVYVYGVPSMRLIKTIPVFTPDPRSGYGFTPDTKAMLGGYTWGDDHHPVMSQTNGTYDGRWLFVNDKANNRVGEVDLKTFETKQILNLPNEIGTHSLTITPDSKYLFTASEYSAPLNNGPAQGNYAPLNAYSEKYFGILSSIGLGSDGKMNLNWEMLTAPYDYDLAAAGKAVSDGWVFVSSYNSEEATTDTEVNSTKNSRDYVLVVNYVEAQKLVDAGQYDFVNNGVKMIDPRKHPGLAYLIPCGKNPHGVDVSPNGQWVVASGKLDPIVTVYDFNKIKAAIEKKDFQGTGWGNLPVLNYNDVMTAEIQVGLGPLHTQFDDKGYAYTSLFVESAVTKWQLGTWKVVEKIPVNYNVGHIAVAGGDSEHPYGQFLIALDKMSQNRFLPVGPGYPVNEQLIDISGSSMKLLREAPANREPHYAVIVPANVIKAENVYPVGKSGNPNAITAENQAKVVRNGNQVTVYMAAIRSHFTPDQLTVKQGDKVTIYLTNLEQQPNITHGFAVSDYNINVAVDPGQTKVVQFTADKPGVFPFYCTDFCSALHEEMMGYLTVQP
ncbi:MAG: Sec-dependent nitrous-oxide reductase [Alicyclobacillus sp.]|nr:Sec-dependent nitrous-oxide reductase [Alicyclobacillus sp.]